MMLCFIYGNFTEPFYPILYYGSNAVHRGGQYYLQNNQFTGMFSSFIMRRVSMKIQAAFIAVSVGLFWAGIAALTLPLITMPVFLITCTITFIAVGLCLAGSETTGFDRGQV